MSLGDFLQRLVGSTPPLRAEDCYEDARWAEFVADAEQVHAWYRTDFARLQYARPLIDAPAGDKINVLLAGMTRLARLQVGLAELRSNRMSDTRWGTAYAVRAIVTRLLQTALPFDPNTLGSMLRLAVAGDSIWVALPLAGVIRSVERYLTSGDHPELEVQHVDALKKLRERVEKRRSQGEARKLIHRIDTLAGKEPKVSAGAVPIEMGEPWADAALSDLAAMPPERRERWLAILLHALAARTSAPSGKWLKTAENKIAEIGQPQFIASICSWLPLVGKPGPGRPMRGWTGRVLDPTVLSEQNADVLKGLVWASSVTNDPTVASLLGDVAEVCFKKIPTHGARCPKVANASLVALSLMRVPDAVAQLARIKGKVKKASARRVVEKALGRSASNQGVSQEELEEISVPDFGFDAAGRKSVEIGDAVAEIQIISPAEITLRWRTSSVKTQSSIPAQIKADHASALKELKRLIKDAQAVLTSRVKLLEQLLLEERTWPVKVWRQRYVDHPLVGQIAKRLIWRSASSSPLTFFAGSEGFVDSAGNAVDIPPDAQIGLWHPIYASAELVQSWRKFLVDREVVQPFKQGHREVYLLTDAERATDTYSNRFAAHILRQHQFQALCDARGWTFKLMGNFDSHNTPTRVLAREQFSVQFWVDGAPPDASPSGIFLYISTDQVRFCRGGQPVRLETVPPIVFSELMRDIDLFVGVASVGNDPNWQNGGPERYQTYWANYSFGELSETAQTRREVLQTLLPRLTKIRDRCSLDEKFLIVKGRLRTYKIHLGSGNILMEPNDQYLCIVPDRSVRSNGEEVFLPFEGDSTLSIVLSKAFLLADDQKITDSTIIRQINR